MKEEILGILREDLPKDVLDKMPEWFLTLREAYKKRQIHQTFS